MTARPTARRRPVFLGFLAVLGMIATAVIMAALRAWSVLAITAGLGLVIVWLWSWRTDR